MHIGKSQKSVCFIKVWASPKGAKLESSFENWEQGPLVVIKVSPQVGFVLRGEERGLMKTYIGNTIHTKQAILMDIVVVLKDLFILNIPTTD